MPNKVKNYIFIRYEDLLFDFVNTMNKIKDRGLNVKEDIIFPLNTIQYKKSNKVFKPNSKKNQIDKKRILNNKNFNSFYEKQLNYELR